LRVKLPPRRQGIVERRTWHTPDGAEFAFHVTVNFAAEGASRLSWGRPLEIFLRPTRSSARFGAFLHTMADDTGEQLSLLLQHGMSASDLAERFKPGGLSRAAAGWVIEIMRAQHKLVGLEP
jgi:hypothetical protein